MTGPQQLRLKGVVQSRGDASGLLKSAGDAVLIERGRPRWLLISCPCGCGEEFPINLDPRSGKAWKLYRINHDLISLYPSVWRDSGCYCHYVIWRNKIYVLGQNNDDAFDRDSKIKEINQISKEVFSKFPIMGLISFVKIADEMGEIPWDILMICRKLVQNGIAYEGKDEDCGSFGRRSDIF